MPPLCMWSPSFWGRAGGTTARAEPEPPCCEPAPCLAQLALAMPKNTEASKTTDVSHPPLGGLCRRVGTWLEAVTRAAALQSSAAVHGRGELSLGLPPGQLMAAPRSGEVSPLKRVPPSARASVREGAGLLRSAQPLRALGAGQGLGRAPLSPSAPCSRRLRSAPKHARAFNVRYRVSCYHFPQRLHEPAAFSHLKGDVPLAQVPGTSCSLVTEDLIPDDSQTARLQGPRL